MNQNAKNLISIARENKIVFDLYLINVDLKEFPVELFDCPWLKTINLTVNNIKEIPENIKMLQNLESLKIGNNVIKKIPRELVFLPKLKRLEISNNPLIEPPIEVANQGLDAIRNYFLQLS